MQLATACEAAALASERLARQVAELQARWREAAGRPRRRALNALAGAGVLAQVTVGKRNRMWETVGLFPLVDEMERQLSAGARGPVVTS